MQWNFAGKRIVVTGGANGIGLAISKELVAAGGAVRVLDLEREEPAETAAAFGAQGDTVDVTDVHSIHEAFARAEDPDIVIVNAGIALTAPLLETSRELWDKTLAVNLSGAFHTLQAAAARMKRRGSGAIVLTASTNSFDGEADLAAYNASKAGVLGILHTSANELGPYGIRVNAVCPGLIQTRLTAGSFADPNILRDYFRHIPMGRGGRPEEVAQAVLFLASEAASYITGTALFVDGGQMASKFGTWGRDGDEFDGQKWTRRRG